MPGPARPVNDAVDGIDPAADAPLTGDRTRALDTVRDTGGSRRSAFAADTADALEK